MNAIIGMTNIGKNTADMERMAYCFEKIEDASKLLLGIINDILDMSKIEAGKLELALVEFDFEKMLQRVVNVVNFRVDEKRQKMTIYVDRAIPQYVVGDDQRLAQVITNLLGNAVKFTPDGGSISVKTYFLGEEDGMCSVRISIKDTGIGISPEQLGNLFQSFQQAESSTSRKFGGTGLGLVISKNIVELMGGEINAVSEAGVGSTFSVTLQLKRGERKRAPLAERKLSREDARILVVDDDKYILDDFKGIIESLGASCDTAADAEEAMQIVEADGAYDIYFIDWQLPGACGIDLAAELKNGVYGHENVLAVMISSAEISAFATEAKAVGVDKFLQKPLFPSSIANIISEYLGHDDLLPEEPKRDVTGIYAGRRILLAEDVDINREIVLTLLEETGLTIDCAVNGAEALMMFTTEPDRYDAIFMDVQMPEMDGYEGTRRIRASGAPRCLHVPIIAMTANVFKEDVDNCINAGMNGHIGKPLDMDALFEILDKYLK